ncbi:hypothetical protein [Armatimonas sp.]|uniref:hypothetical protein n=1 Tax=Armatimonas sp. TaxID=1872638 RepID=UPI00374CD6CE
MRRNLFFVGALALVAGCSSTGTTTPQLNLPTAAQLRAVPLSLGVGGKTLKGETHVWRNLMPMVGETVPNGIIVSITIKTDDSAAVPGGLRAERVTVANGDEVWTSTVVEIRSEETSFGAVVRGGPEWAVGASTDVVVDFRDSSGGVYQLRAVGQVVQGAF